MASPPIRPEGAIRQAHQEALGAWMARHGGALRRYFQKRVGAAEAEDLVQEVFLVMHQRNTATPIGNVQGYLFRVAASVLSKRACDPAFGGRLNDDGLDDNEPLIEEISPERILMGKQALSRMIVALQALPPRARQAFVLHRFEEMTYAAIAARMSISVSAVEQLLSRASERMTAAMEKRA